MASGLIEYKVLICASSEWRTLLNTLVAITWSDGHYVRPVELRDHDRLQKQLTDAVAATNVVVVVGSASEEGVRETCLLAARSARPVLVYLTEWSQHLEELRRIIRDAPGGSQLLCMQSPEEITKEYLIGFNRIIRGLDKESLDRGANIYVPNIFLRKFAALARQWQVLNARCEQNADLKSIAATFALSKYLTLLEKAGVTNWFFESGSSIAYLAEALIGSWSQYLSRIELRTNNILTYLECASAESLRFSLYPAGRPEDKYGATLGALRSLPQLPHSDAHPIKDGARFEIDVIKDDLLTFFGERGMIFAATSGIELGVVGRYVGPHVGGYYNMLFKRALLEVCLEQSIPMMILADEDKLPYEFHPDRCFAICDEKLPWEKACREAPLAIACSFRSEGRKMEEVKSKLYESGFRHFESERPGQKPWSIIASNDKFWMARNSWVRGRETVADSTETPILHHQSTMSLQ